MAFRAGKYQSEEQRHQSFTQLSLKGCRKLHAETGDVQFSVPVARDNYMVIGEGKYRFNQVNQQFTLFQQYSKAHISKQG
ncbi:MAG: hypothetical protein KDC54_19325 [Lewinella sp.]|nr:hypothetical protein [Lewinella sp.]